MVIIQKCEHCFICNAHIVPLYQKADLPKKDRQQLEPISTNQEAGLFDPSCDKPDIRIADFHKSEWAKIDPIESFPTDRRKF